jgi:carbon monoxide dehydrogenase subunit G
MQRPPGPRRATGETDPRQASGGQVVTRYRYSIHLDAPPERVFDALTDPHRIPAWHSGVEVEDVSGPLGVGTTFTIVSSMLGRRQAFPRTVTVYDRPRRFAMEGPGGRLSAACEATAGGTDLTTEEEFAMPLGRVGEWAGRRLFGRWMRGEIDRSLRHLKALVEAESGVPA